MPRKSGPLTCVAHSLVNYVNSFYIISKITKEVNSIFFGILISKPSAIKEYNILEISPFTTSSL